MIRVRIYVSGIVQGVFFRDFTRRKAQGLKIKGWVRNLPDGRVEAVGEGEEENIREWIRHLRKGPPGAKVDNLEINYEEVKGDFQSFSILY